MSYINDTVLQSATGQSTAQQVTSGQNNNPTRSAAAAAITPAVISAVGDVASTLFGNSAQKAENQRNRDFELEMWNRNNEYNLPVNQRKRLEDAGYNPYLLDSDSESSGKSTVPPAPSTSPLMSFGHPFSASAELIQKGLQVQANQEQQHADAMQKIYDILFDAYDRGGQKLYDEAKEELAPLMQRFEWNGSVRAQQLEYDINKKRLDNVQIDISNQREQLELDLRKAFGSKEADAKLREIDKNISLMTQKIDTLRSEGKLNYAKAHELGSEYVRNLAEAGLFKSQSSQIQVLLPYTRSILEDDSLRSSMDFEEKQAEFDSNSDVRKQKRKSVTKGSKSLEYATHYNYLSALLRGASDEIGNIGANVSKFVAPLKPAPSKPVSVGGFWSGQ